MKSLRLDLKVWLHHKNKKHSDYVNKINIKYDGNIVVIGQFIDWITPIEHYCIKHNNTFYTSPNGMLYQKGRKGCLECSNKEKWTYLRLITTLALLCFPDGTPKFQLLTSEKDFNRDFDGNKTRIRLRCTLDGYEWETSINNLISGGTGCARCSGNEEWTYPRLQEAISELRYPDGSSVCTLETTEADFLEAYEKDGAYAKILVRCTVNQEHSWWVRIDSLIYSGSRCPHCKATGYSKSEIEWLEFVMADERIYIQHAKNGGQVKINGRFVDGMCYEINSIYQFHGDYWHGNPAKYDPDFVNPSSYERMGDRYEETLIKDQELRDQGYNVVIMWEAEWNEIKKKLKKLPIEK